MGDAACEGKMPLRWGGRRRGTCLRGTLGNEKKIRRPVGHREAIVRNRAGIDAEQPGLVQQNGAVKKSKGCARMGCPLNSLNGNHRPKQSPTQCESPRRGWRAHHTGPALRGKYT